MARGSGLALVVAVLALLAAACGSNSRRTATTGVAASHGSSAPCKLTTAQRRGKARALADIRRLRRIEAPVQTSSQRGAPHQEEVTGEFLMDLGSAHLPVSEFSRLLHLAKAAVRLCGDCSTGLETEEPVLGNRGLSHGSCR